MLRCFCLLLVKNPSLIFLNKLEVFLILYFERVKLILLGESVVIMALKSFITVKQPLNEGGETASNISQLSYSYYILFLLLEFRGLRVMVINENTRFLHYVIHKNKG